MRGTPPPIAASRACSAPRTFAPCIAGSQGREDGAAHAALRERRRAAGAAGDGEKEPERPRPDGDSYLGKAKADELKSATQEADANLIHCKDELLPGQERNLQH